MFKSKPSDKSVSDCGSPDEMPAFKRHDKVLQQIFLTDLTEKDKNNLVCKELDKYIKNGIEIKTWTPSLELLSSISKQGPYRDSQANIYALAMLALKSGLEFGSAGTSFLVADDLTKRILQRTLIPIESKKDIVVMVTVRTEPRKTTMRSIDDDFYVNHDSESEFRLGKVSYKPRPEPDTNKDGIRVVVTRFQRQTFQQLAMQWKGEDQRADHSVGNTGYAADAEYENSHFGRLPALLNKYQAGNSHHYFQEYEGSGFDEYDCVNNLRASMVLRDPNAAPFTTQHIVSDLRDCPRERSIKNIVSRGMTTPT
ncbi:uncharacterized protein N7483_005484 [Penicillium malachiteum]|uniref:uncharacterized protein n=1 Tax=Penicillium malachiteum TaxID=1324776 RepID=UPI002548F724|nr:uncharacterized protein N7483_005484 [Penicillium malachiteum]KAJ5730976.1 hypothetical protein N7483_005484 [Penicillium malachiteum]